MGRRSPPRPGCRPTLSRDRAACPFRQGSRGGRCASGDLTMPSMPPARPLARWPLLLATALGACLAAAPLAAQPLERARAAQQRGDMRAAQIELRHAVRSDPNSAARRAALAALSLDIGDGDTGEKEARAALERGHDPAAGTALLLRAYLVRNRFQELLRDFPMPPDEAR